MLLSLFAPNTPSCFVLAHFVCSYVYMQKHETTITTMCSVSSLNEYTEKNVIYLIL